MSVDVNEKKYKVPEAARLSGHSAKTWWNWIAEGRVGVYRIGRSVRIGESEIKRLLEQGYSPARSAV
jgi:excisionase family DNA binding protein